MQNFMHSRNTSMVSAFSFPTSFIHPAVPFTARTPIRIMIHGHIYDITKLPGGNKRKLQDYSHSRRTPNEDSFLMYNNKKAGTYIP